MYVENLAKLKSILDDNKRDLDNTINYRQLKKCYTRFRQHREFI